jgi:hypothetical protein
MEKSFTSWNSWSLEHKKNSHGYPARWLEIIDKKLFSKETYNIVGLRMLFIQISHIQPQNATKQKYSLIVDYPISF